VLADVAGDKVVPELPHAAQLLRTADSLYSFSLLGVHPNHTYECRWSTRD
jgi:hypothetical protein